MRLISAQIRNYNNVVDSKEFRIDNVTCLAGQNIGVKTDTLQALTKLNPADPFDGNFFDLRRPGGGLGELNDRPENVLKTRWFLMQDDIRALEEYLGRDSLTDEVVTIRKGYKNELQWEIPIDYDRYPADAPGGVMDRDYTVRSFESGAGPDLLPSLNAPSQGYDGEKQVSKYQINRTRAKMIGKETLGKRLPRFLYAAVHDIVASDASLTDLVRKRQTDSFSTGEKILLDWLALAGTSPEHMLKDADIEAVVWRMSQQAQTFCDKINQYWPHYSELAFDISVTPAVPKAPGSHSVDQQIRLRVTSRQNGDTESIDESRSGFLWFFSFLIRYSRASASYNSNLILLLDEPGLTENAKAQSALLTYFSRELSPRHQLIYSAHLPSMIDQTLF